MGEQLASKVDADFKAHVAGSATWARLNEGRGLSLVETAELAGMLTGGVIAGLKTLARAIDDPAEPDAA
jgi:hypothetical protein